MSSKELKKLLKGLPKLNSKNSLSSAVALTKSFKKSNPSSPSSSSFNLDAFASANALSKKNGGFKFKHLEQSPSSSSSAVKTPTTTTTTGHIRVSDKLKDCLFDPIKIKNLTRDIISLTSRSGYGVTILFCGNKYMTTLNEKDRKKKGPTDILSYPVYSPDLEHNFALMEKDAAFNDDLAAILANEHKILMEEEKFLGDLVISQPYIVDYCRENNISLDHHMVLLLTHGVLHLLGFDHETESDYVIMKQHEDEILSKLEKKYGKEQWSKLKITK